MVMMRGLRSGTDGPERAVLEVFGSINTTLIEMFDECYANITVAVAAAAIEAIVTTRLQEGGSMQYREFSNT